MSEQSPLGIPVRPTSKIVLRGLEGGIVTVAGKRGRFNIPGGGLEDGESHTDALLRELKEELGLMPDCLRGLREVGNVSDTVTPRDDDPYIAQWRVHEGELLVPVRELVPGDEIQSVGAWSSERFLLPPRGILVSNLAQRAVRMVI